MTISVDRLGRRHPRRLSSEEIERRKKEWKKYVSTRPDVTYKEIFFNRRIRNIVAYLYKGKVERALFDAITDGADPNEVPADHFRPLVSYMASRISGYLQRAGILVPSIEDMKQDGMVAVLKAQKKVDTCYAPDQIRSFFRQAIKRNIIRGLEHALSTVTLPQPSSDNSLMNLAFLCQYELSALEGRSVKGEEFFRGYKNETIDRLARICKGRNLGLGLLEHAHDSSEKENEEDRSAVRQDIDFLMSGLSQRDKEILLCHLQGQTYREIGEERNLSYPRIGQIVGWEVVDKLRRRMRHLLAVEDPHAMRLYREYFEK